MTFSENALFV